MAQFISELESLLPKNRVYTDGPSILPYESDGLTAFRARPRAVVIPESEEEVVSIVKLCHEHNVPFVARGSGTSLSGGSLPIEEGIVIGLNRLNRILEVNTKDRVAVVQTGVINLQVSAAVAQYGLYFAPDPSSQSVCTIGGNVAFNSGGAHCLKYGMTSNHILGLKVVLPDGEVMFLGNDSLESVGPDAVGLYVGNEGLFGIATEIRLRLLPLPETYRTVMASYSSLQTAGDAVSRVVSSGILPAAMEIMDRLTMDAAEAAVNAGYPKDAKAALIVELDGEAAAVDAEFDSIIKIIEQSGADHIHIAQSAEERMLIWKGRKSAFSAVGRLAPDFLVQDGVVPRGKLGQALQDIEKLSEEYGIRVANVFHAGDGNLHPLILFDGSIPGQLEKAEELAGKILRLCLRLGGSITGEHGVGVEKKEYMAEMFNEDDLDAFKRIRKSLDPKEISNRGKMFPSGKAQSLGQHGMHPLEKAGVISRE